MEGLILSIFGLEAEDLPGLPFSLLAAFTALGGYMLITPIADNAAATAGNAMLPVITVATLGVVAVAGQAYQMLVSHVGMDLVMPIVYRVLVLLVLVFAVGLAGSHDEANRSWSFALYVAATPLGS